MMKIRLQIVFLLPWDWTLVSPVQTHSFTTQASDLDWVMNKWAHIVTSRQLILAIFTMFTWFRFV